MAFPKANTYQLLQVPLSSHQIFHQNERIQRQPTDLVSIQHFDSTTPWKLVVMHDSIYKLHQPLVRLSSSHPQLLKAAAGLAIKELSVSISTLPLQNTALYRNR